MDGRTQREGFGMLSVTWLPPCLIPEGFTGSPCSGRIWVNESWNWTQLCRHHLINHKQAWGLEIMSPWGENYYMNHSTCMLGRFCQIWLCNTMDYSPLGSSVHGLLQARILEWVAMPSSKGSSPPRNQNRIYSISCIADGFFTAEPSGKPQNHCRMWQRYSCFFFNSTCYLAYLRRDRKPDSCEPLKWSEVISWTDDLLLNPWQSREVLRIIDGL